MEAGVREKTIALCMIVKNESKVILECLRSVQPLVDYVMIEDTGSSDGTQDIVRSYLAEKHLPGEVIEEPWQDFAHNRTHALRKIRERQDIDYVLMIDADEQIIYDDGFDPRVFKQNLDKDVYFVPIKLFTLSYQRAQIIRNDKEFYFKGVIHEFLEGPPSGYTSESAHGFFMLSGRGGARSKDPKKYHRDLGVLKGALVREKDPFLRSRYTFYLAQSYRDAEKKQKALFHYSERAKLGFWNEEIYMSLYEAAKLKEDLGHTAHDIIGTFLSAYEIVPQRVEALHGVARYCRIHSKFHQGYMVAKHALELKQPENGLFLLPWIYEYGVLDEFAILAYWTGRHQECLDACERLLSEGKLPESERPRIQMNANFARKGLGLEVAEPA